MNTILQKLKISESELCESKALSQKRESDCFDTKDQQEPPDYIDVSAEDYYHFRNAGILDALNGREVSAESRWEEVRKATDHKIYTYRYKEAELILLGVRDYLKGIDWFIAHDAEALDLAVKKLGYKRVPVSTIKKGFDLKGSKDEAGRAEGSVQKAIRHLTLNGMLLPSVRNVVVSADKPKRRDCYQAERVLNYDRKTKTGFVTEKDFGSYREIKKLYKEIKSLFFRTYDGVSKEYADRAAELDGHIQRDGGSAVPCDYDTEYRSVLPDFIRPKDKKKEKQTLSFVRRKLLLQRLMTRQSVNMNRVMVEVHRRKGFTCNPKYIVNKLIELYGDKIDLYWVTDHPDTCEEVKEKGVKVIETDSEEHYRTYLGARVYITNDMFPAWAEHKKDQIWINTWHGAISYKHIGYKYLSPKSEAGETLFRLGNRQADHYLAATRTFADDTAESFEFDKEIFLGTGLPRNDIFFENSEEARRAVREALKVNEADRIVLYAPTFRKGLKSGAQGLDYEDMRKALSQRFGGSWTIMFRDHGFVKKTAKGLADVINVTDYPDMNELLNAADVLVSDYSSCMYDFVLQEKPCFVFASDLDEYIRNDRSFAVPLEKWPYPLAETNEALVRNILNFDEEDYRQALKRHFEEVVRYDDGKASERAAKIVGYYCGFESSNIADSMIIYPPAGQDSRQQ